MVYDAILNFSNNKFVTYSIDAIQRSLLAFYYSNSFDKIKYTNIFSLSRTSTRFLITDFCPGGELFALIDKQQMNIFKEESARYFYTFVI